METESSSSEETTTDDEDTSSNEGESSEEEEDKQGENKNSYNNQASPRHCHSPQTVIRHQQSCLLCTKTCTTQ